MTAQQGHSNKTGGSNSIGNSNKNNNTTTANEPKITSAAIEQALQYDVGTEAKKLIMQYIQQKYGMDFELVGQYRKEFENYLREVLHESAEIIIARIRRSIIQDSKRTLATTTSSSTTVYRNAATSKRLSDSVHFLFCDQCFWSASSLSRTFELKCMSCGSELKCALPISQNEVFAYELDHKRGVTIYFS
jgi:hypothetical protein